MILVLVWYLNLVLVWYLEQVVVDTDCFALILDVGLNIFLLIDINRFRNLILVVVLIVVLAWNSHVI